MVGSLIAGVAILVILVLVAMRLSKQGQFASERWNPLVNPSDPAFPLLWKLLGRGLVATLEAAALAIAFSWRSAPCWAWPGWFSAGPRGFR